MPHRTFRYFALCTLLLLLFCNERYDKKVQAYNYLALWSAKYSAGTRLRDYQCRVLKSLFARHALPVFLTVRLNISKYYNYTEPR